MMSDLRIVHQVLLNHVELFDIVFHVHQLIKSISLILIFLRNYAYFTYIFYQDHVRVFVHIDICMCMLCLAAPSKQQ